jgi:uncharacterized lipoprotein YmbA
VKTPALVPVIALLVVLMGCSLRAAPPRTYVLSAASEPERTGPPRAPAVAVGPVTLAAYLDSQSVVVREGGGEIRLSPAHQWAEPLRDGMARVIAENLAALIPTDAVALFPWRSPTSVTYRVTAEVFRFDGPLGGPVMLSAQWRLLDGSGKELVRRAVALDEPVADSTYGAFVAAQNRLLAAVSRDIAASIRTRPP